MNCKEGDLAIVIKSLKGKSIGKIVRCVKFDPEIGLRSPGGLIEYGAWETDGVFVGWGNGRKHPYIPDAWLHPIRDQPGEDEMLRIAGLPIDKKVPA